MTNLDEMWKQRNEIDIPNRTNPETVKQSKPNGNLIIATTKTNKSNLVKKCI